MLTISELVHRWKGGIGAFEADVKSVMTGKDVEVGKVDLECPNGICPQLPYSFPISSDQTSADALSARSLPSCKHGTRVLPQ